jgi:uncharacterized membrane protein YhaH (DUF805 family)
MDWKTLFLSPQGRIGQKDFWIGIAILTAAWWLAHLVPPFGYLIHVLLIFPFVCLHTKRLHDLGKSGFIQLIPDLVGLVCFIVGVMWLGSGLVSAVARGDGLAVAGLLMGALLLVALVACGPWSAWASCSGRASRRASRATTAMAPRGPAASSTLRRPRRPRRPSRSDRGFKSDRCVGDQEAGLGPWAAPAPRWAREEEKRKRRWLRQGRRLRPRPHRGAQRH